MKLEDQVCSLDLAKRLKELGVPQESLFYWFDSKMDGPYRWCLTYEYKQKSKTPDMVSAFTVAELGELLDYDFTFKRLKKKPKWRCAHLTSDTEADARAKMLIHLIEQKIVNPELLGKEGNNV